MGRKQTSEAFGMFGMLQHQRALQVPVAVQTGTQQKMAFEECAGIRKNTD
jgi:hypothetical protein